MKLKPILYLLVLSAGVAAQTTQGYATVHVYRHDKDAFYLGFIFTRTMRVSLREASVSKKQQSNVASLRNKRYLTLQLAPGDYFFTSRGVDDFSVKVSEGEEIFLRYDSGEHDGCNSGELSIGMCPETRGPEVKSLRQAKLVPTSPN